MHNKHSDHHKKYSTVAEFLDDLDDDKKTQVETLRQLILDTEPALEELIKWNAPSYVHNGEDRITFNLHNKENAVKLILHMGATKKEDKKAKPVLNDETGLIVWNSDIRGRLTFDGLEDIKEKRDGVALLVRQWLAITP